LAHPYPLLVENPEPGFPPWTIIHWEWWSKTRAGTQVALEYDRALGPLVSRPQNGKDINAWEFLLLEWKLSFELSWVSWLKVRNKFQS
jgi:hypothetical protein